jgi:hypothetical protein
MRVRMLVAMPDGATVDGQPWPKRGQEGDFPPHQADHFVASGIAEHVDHPKRGDTDTTPKEVTDDGEVRTDERKDVRRKR